MATVLPLRQQQPVGKENGEGELAVHPAASQHPRTQTTTGDGGSLAQQGSGSLTVKAGSDITTLQPQRSFALPNHTPPHSTSP